MSNELLLLLVGLTAAVQVVLGDHERKLPDGNLILGYEPHCTSDGDRVVRIAASGVNVINWFQINLNGGPNGPEIAFGLNATCIANVARRLRNANLPTTHIITIGGWNAPHPNTSYTGAEWWVYWKKWNTDVVARPELGFYGFDGIDWDLEGNNAVDRYILCFCADVCSDASV